MSADNERSDMSAMTPADIDEAHDKAMREGEEAVSRVLMGATIGDCTDYAIRAYLAAMERAGWVMVPVEATERMALAARIEWAGAPAYAAAIAARPVLKP